MVQLVDWGLELALLLAYFCKVLIMAAFDFGTLLQNPTFQFGATLLSNPRQPGAVGQAFGAMQQAAKLKAQQDEAAASLAQRKEWQDAQTQNLKEARVAEAMKADAAAKHEERLQKQWEMQQARQEAFLKANPDLMDMMGQVGAAQPMQPAPTDAAQPQPQEATPMAAPQEAAPAGPITIPPPAAMPEAPAGAQGQSFMYSRPQPGALSPMPQGGAMPPTPIGNFNPDDPRDVAGPFNGGQRPGQFGAPSLQPNKRPMLRASMDGGDAPNLTAQNGDVLQQAIQNDRINSGSTAMNAAMADAGDGGGGEVQAPTGAPTAAPTVQRPSMSAADKMQRKAEAAAMLGFPPAMVSAISKRAEMMQPKNVPAGGYQTGPDGKMQYIPNPQDAARNAQAQEHIAIAKGQLGVAAANNKISQQNADIHAREVEGTIAKNKADLEEKQQKALATKQTDIGNYQEKASMMDALYKSTDELLHHPGLESNTGWRGIAHAYNLTENGRDANALMETVKNKLVIDTMMKLKDASKTGSTGFGQLSEKEGERLETYIANLSKAQSLPAMQKALGDIKDFSLQAKGRLGKHLTATYGKDALDAASEDATPAAPPPTAKPAGIPQGWAVRVK